MDLSRVLKASVAESTLGVAQFSMTDLRRSARRDIWCECTVARHGATLRDGVIVNISQTGARVKFRMRGTLPDQVIIRAPRLGLNRPARVIWQDTCDAGLSF